MLTLSPSASLRAENALETVSRAPLAPLSNREIPRHLSAIPPSVRCLPIDLQVVELANMLADAREQRNDRNATVRDLRQRLMLSEQACGRALRQFDAFVQLVRIRDESLFNSVCATLSR